MWYKVYIFQEVTPYAIVNDGMTNVKVKGHWERKHKNRFSHVSSSKVDRYMSNETKLTMAYSTHFVDFISLVGNALFL